MMLIGYARVSTDDQNLGLQRTAFGEGRLRTHSTNNIIEQRRAKLGPASHADRGRTDFDFMPGLKPIQQGPMVCPVYRAMERTMSQPRKSSASVKRSSTGSMSLKREATTGRFRGSQILGASAPLISTFIDEGGHVVVELVADSFGMSKGQLAETVGLGRETFYKATRARAPKTQSRIREMLEIVSRISTWAGGKEQAMAWYRAQPIPAFGDRTAEALVKSGKAAAVRDYLDHLALGGFA